MSFKKLLILSFVASLSIFNLHAENHDAEQNIIDKAKEINKKVKEKQADQQANISSEIGKEEPLPLNDPFVGDASLGGASTVSVITNSDEERAEMSLYNFLATSDNSPKTSRRPSSNAASIFALCVSLFAISNIEISSGKSL